MEGGADSLQLLNFFIAAATLTFVTETNAKLVRNLCGMSGVIAERIWNVGDFKGWEFIVKMCMWKEEQKKSKRIRRESNLRQVFFYSCLYR